MPFPEISDAQMRDLLHDFLTAHGEKINVPTSSISFINEGTFTSIRRMRTLLPLAAVPGPYAKASTLEMRGTWSYPMMMMNDCMPIDPDPPTIFLRDPCGNVVARFRPTSIDNAKEILRLHVFDIDNIDRRRKEAEREMQRSLFLAQKQREAKEQVQKSIAAVATRSHEAVGAIAQQLASDLNACEKVPLYSDLEQHTRVSVVQAYRGDIVKALSAEVERILYAALRAHVQ